MSQTYDTEKRKEFVKDSRPGFQVAVINDDGSYSEATIIENLHDKELLLVKVDDNSEKILEYSDVAWVKVGKFWPKGVHKNLRK